MANRLPADLVFQPPSRWYSPSTGTLVTVNKMACGFAGYSPNVTNVRQRTITLELKAQDGNDEAPVAIISVKTNILNKDTSVSKLTTQDVYDTLLAFCALAETAGLSSTAVCS